MMGLGQCVEETPYTRHVKVSTKFSVGNMTGQHKAQARYPQNFADQILRSSGLGLLGSTRENHVNTFKTSID